MKINVILGHAFPVPNVIGGAIERVCWELANEWARQGHDTALYSRQWPQFPNQDTLSSGLKVFRVKGYSWSGSRCRNLGNALRYAVSLKNHVRVADVHFSNTFCFPFLASCGKRQAGSLFVGMQREPKLHTRAYELFLRLRPKAPIRFIAVSDFIMREAVRVCPSMKGRITTAPNAVDTSDYTPGRTRWPMPTVLFAGRIVREKGLAELVRAFCQVRDTCSQAVLRIVGPFSEGQGTDEAFLHELRSLVASLNLTQAVVFTGFKEGEALLEEYRKAWVFCYPSYQGEAFPCATIEAMACATPVVTTDWGPFPEQFCNGSEGFQVPARDVERLGRSILGILENAGLRHQMGEAAKTRAQCFSVRRVANRYLNIFQDSDDPGHAEVGIDRRRLCT